MNRRNITFALVALLGILLDQGSKWWIVNHIDVHRGAIEVIPGFLKLVHAQNPGAAMGMMQTLPYRHYLFIAFTVVAVGVIFDMLRKLPQNEWFQPLTLGMIFSGAIGNGIDRVRQQYVTDFILCYTDIPALKSWLIANVGTNEYWTFNIADAALLVGIAMYLLHYMFLEEKEDGKDEEPSVAQPSPPAAR